MINKLQSVLKELNNEKSKETRLLEEAKTTAEELVYSNNIAILEYKAKIIKKIIQKYPNFNECKEELNFLLASSTLPNEVFVPLLQEFFNNYKEEKKDGED